MRLSIPRRLAYLQWMVAHAADLRLLIGYVQDFMDARARRAYREAGEIAGAIVALLFSWFDDFPWQEDASPAALAAGVTFETAAAKYGPHFTAQAIDWAHLITLLPLIFRFMQTAREMWQEMQEQPEQPETD